MSGTNLRAADTSPTRRPRQNRIYSVGLPAQSSLFQDALFPGSNVIPPPLPRRHSVTPADVKPPIPKRSRNERPIPISSNQQQQQQQQQQHQLTQQSQLPKRESGNDPTPSRGSGNATSWQQGASSHGFGAGLEQRLGSSSAEFPVNFDINEEVEEKAFASPRGGALDHASRDLGKRLQNINNPTTTTTTTTTPMITSTSQSGRTQDRGRQQQQHGLRANRSPRRGDRGQRTPISQRQQLQQQQPKSADEDDEEDEDQRNGRRSNNKFAEMQAVSRRLEKRLPELERRFHESGRQEPTSERMRNIERLDKLPKATQTNLPPPLSAICSSQVPKPMNSRQDSNVSSDSFSQTSSPSYTSKTMEAPLLPHKHANGKVPGRALAPEPENPPGSPITKSISTPASLQAIVRIQNGSNMSLHHRIIKDMRRPSSHVTRGRLRFRFAQVLVNAVALMAIAGGLAAYFKSYPATAVKVIDENKNVSTNSEKSVVSEPIFLIAERRNPAPGICLPVIVNFCQYHKIPYNYTVFPNYMGNFRQREAQHELELYDAVIDVHCYELAALFFCSIFVPKCGPKNGQAVSPCRNLCFETKRRCGFFLIVFGLTFPEYFKCDMFPQSSDPNVCIGHQEMIDEAKRAAKPVCPSGFQCDEKRCIPLDWRCDGHVDCEDHTDEIGCGECSDGERSDLVAISSKEHGKKNGAGSVKNLLAKASLHCGERRCISASHICNGIMDCPWAQDERNCLRLSERNGDVGKGRLEVYHAKKGKFMPACIVNWTPTTAKEICALLGYTMVSSSSLLISDSNVTISEPLIDASQRWRLTQMSKGSLLQEFQQCVDQKNYSTIDLICSGYECGRRPRIYGNSKARTRIVGGVESAPGDWPFLAALLGGPEQIFYCAGVLIADQWVLTASHCVGNHSEVSGWTIQLGITRRHAHTYLGKKLKIKRVVPHPNYNLGVAHDNDVALFQLEHRVEFHDHLRPVCLPSADIDLAPGTVCTVIGWGKKEDTETSEYEPAINEVTVPVLGREVCNSWLAHKELNVTDGMICAGYPEGGKDACQGDSGGPLLCQDKNDKNRWFVGGIVSWGIKCAHPQLPGVYAYVPKYVPWILKEIKEYSENDYG